MRRLFTEHRSAADPPPTDAGERIRLDDWEMRADVQAEVAALWEKAAADNVEQLADLAGYREDFFKLFGFGFPGVDYGADADPNVAIPSLGAAAPSADS